MGSWPPELPEPGNVFALDATNGKLLRRRYHGGQMVASLMTYPVNGSHTLYTSGLRE